MATKALNYTTAEINQRLNLAGTAVQPNALDDYYIKTEVDGKVVVDLSTRYNTSYANLSAALTALNSDTSTGATAIKKGGVSIKFINSTTNKYEQWNLKASSWSTNESDWICYEKSKKTRTYTQGTINGYGIKATNGTLAAFEGWRASEFLPVPESMVLTYGNQAISFGIAFYSAANESAFISGVVYHNQSNVQLTIPSNATHFRYCSCDDHAVGLTLVCTSQSEQYISDLIYGLQDDVSTLQDDVNELKNGNTSIRFSSVLDVRTQSVNILFVGNSWSRDAIAYVPKMLQVYNVNYKIGILYVGGGSIQTHVQNIGSNIYTYNSHNNSDSDWQAESSKSLEYGVKKENWDIIIFSQVSNSSGYKNISSLTPYFGTLLNTVKGYLTDSQNFSGSVKFAWLMTPAYPNAKASSYQNSSKKMMEDIVKMGVYIYNNYDIDFLIPEGIAIQNARATSLEQYGDYDSSHTSGETGGLMYLDTSLHLQEGIGRQIAASLCLYSIFGISPMGNKERFTTNSSMEPHGNAEGSNDSNSWIAQECAVKAIKFSLDVVDEVSN